MAWFMSAKSNAELVRSLCLQGVIKSEAVKNAMLAVDRAYFSREIPYMDCPQPIGYAATISAPHMHAHALELLHGKLRPGAKVLDIGSGSGYLCACFATMIGSHGKVIGIEHIDDLANLSIRNLTEWNKTSLENGNIKIYASDGRLGWPNEAPYDVIHVGAASPSIPEELLKQLKKGGRMVIPVGKEYSRQFLVQIDKLENGQIVKKSVADVQFVPLTNKEYQLFER